MLICSQCRFENPHENRFCQRCGAPLEAELLSQEELIPESAGAKTLPPTQQEHQQTTLIQPPQDVSLSSGADSTIASGPPTFGKTHPDPDPWAEKTEGNHLESMSADRSIAMEEGDTIAPDSYAPESCLAESEEEDTVFMPTEDETEFGLMEDEDEDLPTMLLPMQLARLDSAGITHVGRQRDHNEDYFDTDTQLTYSESPRGRDVQARGLYVLCDGMGGHSAGEVASAMAVEQLKTYFQSHWKDSLPDQNCIRDAILTANQAIFEVNERNASAGSGRMGTTLVLMLLQDTKVAIAHVGDSRLYTYSRRQGLEQQTVDHEVGQLEVLRGVEPEVAYARPESYQLTQALGPKGNDYVDPEIKFLELHEDTIFLLCSDGLSDYGLLEEHAQGRIEPLLSSRASLEQGVGELINLANEFNGHDNVTAITIRVKVRPDVRTIRS